MTPWVLLVLASLSYSLLLASLAYRITARFGSPPGLGRKIFHVGIFTGAAPAQLLMGFWGVVSYGGAVAILVLLAVLRGEEALLSRVLARPGREKDGRGEVLVPLLATALGGLLGVLLVGRFAIVGYLTCGWGDAAGEMVGRRWGRHRYRVPFSPQGSRQRSLEGSLGVVGVGFLGAWAGLDLLGFPFLSALAAGGAVGLVAGGVEALSPPGSDNLWVQLLPALSAWWLLG